MRGIVFEGLRIGALGLLGLWATVYPCAAHAAPVRGTVTLPPDLKSGRRHPGYWRVENGVVPVQAPANRTETLVVLVGPKGQAPAAKTVTVEIAGLAATPASVVVGEGSVVEFRNADKVPHDLSIPDQPALMAMERLSPGGVRRVKFLAAGGYAVRCAEYPHLLISVIVVASPHHATLDDKGGFKLPDAPDGKATLKVWSHGRWIHEEEIEVGKSGDLQITVSSKGGSKAGGD
jgi:plastocyanin